MYVNGPRTICEKIWNSHLVASPSEPGFPAILYVDFHYLHEVSSPQAFSNLAAKGLSVRRPSRTVATMDHSTSTSPTGTFRELQEMDPLAAAQLERLATNCGTHRIPLYALRDRFQGIVHVMGPELGLTRPGMTIVCGDSHTSTHGAFGALGFGIGTSEVEHVLATQCLLQHPPKTYAVQIDGKLSPGVTAKDVILALIAEIGVGAGTGHVFEYLGETIRNLDMEGRMTICNMSIEAGARAGLIAPDETTFEYLAGRPFAPSGEAWEEALEEWRRLPTDPGASYDRSITFPAHEVEPMITYGTNPGMAIPITGRIPGLVEFDEAARLSLKRALAYMDLEPGMSLLGRRIDVVFLGSCTNSRLSDLQAAASLLRGRRLAPGVRMLVVPGSQQVKRRAEEEGLHRVFLDAGAEWREPGCSMCVALNDDRLQPGQYAVSTSNRNFEGRQGPGGRTFLASPLTAAASSITGKITDPRELL